MRAHQPKLTNAEQIRLIEDALAQLGYRMEFSLDVFDGHGHAIVDVASGELEDNPSEVVIEWATAWTLLNALPNHADNLRDASAS